MIEYRATPYAATECVVWSCVVTVPPVTLYGVTDEQIRPSRNQFTLKGFVAL